VWRRRGGVGGLDRRRRQYLEGAIGAGAITACKWLDRLLEQRKRDLVFRVVVVPLLLRVVGL